MRSSFLIAAIAAALSTPQTGRISYDRPRFRGPRKPRSQRIKEVKEARSLVGGTVSKGSMRKIIRLQSRINKPRHDYRGVNRTFKNPARVKFTREQRISAAKQLAHRERMVVRDFAFYLRGNSGERSK